MTFVKTLLMIVPTVAGFFIAISIFALLMIFTVPLVLILTPIHMLINFVEKLLCGKEGLDYE